MQSNEYVKLAEVEDHMWYFRSLHRHVHRELKRKIPAIAAPKLLDAGCGTGGLIQRLQAWETAWQFEGIDFSALACEFAARRCAVPIRQASITSLPFDDGSFDGLVSADVICQVDQPEVALSEFYRCLRPGGVVVINVPAYMWMWSYHDDVCETKHRYRRGELLRLLASAGFEPFFGSYWNTLLFPLLAVRRKWVARSRGTSDVQQYSRPVELAGSAAMAMEHGWIRAVGSLPYGSSVLAAARKPDR
jgi:ubiquinone/menaquinone biosynthesis C-methylase UbiE